MPNLNLNTLTNASSGNNALSAEIQEFYNKNLLAVAEPECAYRRHAQKTKVPKHGGTTVNWRDMKKLGLKTTELTEGVVPDGDKLTIAALTAPIAAYGNYITTTDRIDLMAIDNVVMHAVKRLGLQAAESLDFIAGSEFCNGKNAIFAGGKTSQSGLEDGDIISLNDILLAAQKLKANSAPKIDGTYFGIIHPAVAYDLMKIGNELNCWVDVSKYAAHEKIEKGEIGKLYGVRFVETPNAIVKTANSKNVYQTLIYGDDAFGCVDLEGGNLRTIVKPLGSSGTADPLDMIATVGWKAFDACKLLNDDNVIRIESLSQFAG